MTDPIKGGVSPPAGSPERIADALLAILRTELRAATERAKCAEDELALLREKLASVSKQWIELCLATGQGNQADALNWIEYQRRID